MSAKRRSPVKRPGRRLMNHDRKLGVRFVAGADEVGRGSLAGPLVVAAVVLDYRMLVGPLAAPLGHLDDSKKLTPAARERLYDSVMACAGAYSIILVSPATIDRVGLHRCNIRALDKALRQVRCAADLALVDGFALPDPPLECRRIIKGDATSAAIAAASIVAKVTRDRLMCRLDEEHDGRWAFAEHMGYATELHHERIREHGVSPLHRRSFASVAYSDDMWATSESVADVIDALDAATAVPVHQEHVEAVALDPVL